MHPLHEERYIMGLLHTLRHTPLRCVQGNYSVITIMNSQESFVALVVLVTMTMCSAHIGGGQISYQDVNPQVYCGRSLARVLALVCLDESGVDKRSDAGTMYNAVLSPYYKEQEGQFWPWIAPHKARSIGLPSRGKRFVVNECCEKACSINELMSYC